jgi:hypothetical protein
VKTASNLSDMGLLNMKKVRLVEVQGDQEEFADLIGTEGKLYLGGVNESGDRDGNNWYMPENIEA